MLTLCTLHVNDRQSVAIPLSGDPSKNYVTNHKSIADFAQYKYN